MRTPEDKVREPETPPSDQDKQNRIAELLGLIDDDSTTDDW